MKLPLWRRRQKDELEEELRAHHEAAVRERIERGEPREQAEAAARREFGNVALVKDVTGDAWGWASLERFTQDVRHGLRLMRRSPGFTLAAVLTLALGIGASVAVFSVVNAVLLRSLPYQHPERLVMMWEKTSQEDLPASYLNFVDWKSQNRAFAQMAAFRYDNFNLTGEGEPERLENLTVTADFLSTLGVRPVVGRDFQPQDDRPGAAPTVILSHGFWQRRFGGALDIIGKQLALNRQSFTVIGVMPPHFKFGEGGDILVPLNVMADRFQNRGKDPGLTVVARLKPGVTAEQAHAEMDAIVSRLVEQYPDVLAGRRIAIEAMHEFTVGNIRATLLVLMGAVGFVLLIACTNVANLLLARASSRQREVAVRTALGAGRGRLIRQFLTESVLLSLTGGALGLVLADVATRLVITFSPGNIPRLDEVGVDARVFGFAFLLSLLTGIVYGLFPALQASKPDLNAALKEGERGSTGRRGSVRSVLVVAEVALALVLLIGGGLMIKSFRNLLSVDPGFDPQNLLTLQMAVSANAGEGSKTARFLDQLQQGIEGLPGVRGFAFSNGLPYMGSNQLPLNVEGRPVDTAGQNPIAGMYITSADYFEVMKIRLQRGRAFSPQDTRDSPRVAVIDQVLAHKYFPSEDPVGKRMSLAIPGTPTFEIVGIVEHVKNFGLDDRSPVQPQLYLNFNQIPEQTLPQVVRRLNLVVRSASDPLSLASAVRREVATLDKEQPVFSERTMEAMIADTIAAQKFSMLLLSGFAFAALVLAAVGIYGVMAYSVSQRTREIGVRVALGAKAADIFKLVIGRGLALAFVGLGIGLTVALALTRVLSSLLFNVSATDPATFVAISVLLATVASFAGFVPARRATKVDPIVALRYE